jgi:hypothetical protein
MNLWQKNRESATPDHSSYAAHGIGIRRYIDASDRKIGLQLQASVYEEIIGESVDFWVGRSS